MISLVPTYRPRSSALHSARAGAAASFCAALALPAVLFDSPVALLACSAATLIAAAGAGVLREVLRAARVAVPLGLLVAAINPLVSSEGETLLVRGFHVPGHRFDITLEAVAWGGVFGLRVVVLMLAFALFSSAVDPDETTRLFRRLSYHSALTAALATRLVPVLARDATRMGDASRCRARPPGRAAVGKAVLGGALERAVEVAAALEVRGYAAAARPRRGARRPLSRHDLRVAIAAAALVAVAVGARLAGVAGFDPYPQLALELGPAEVALALVVPALGAAPFAGAAARLGVARA